MERLGKYYTSDIFSRLLVDKLTVANPKNILELGVGGGALVKAVINRWINASYYVTDVDQHSLHKIKEELPFVNSFHFDTVKEDVSKKLQIKQGSFDLAVCNPPYLKMKNDTSFNSLFEEAKLKECINLKLLTTDIIFLAKNLLLLKNSGELGIILPDSLITGKEFEYLRTALIKEHTLKGVIQLPEKVFPKTEALTHILFIEKGNSQNNITPLFLANTSGKIIEQINVNSDSLVERMDFKYHSWRGRSTVDRKMVSLKSLGVEIKRGLLTHKELKLTGDNFIHTTSIKDKCPNQCFSSSKLKNPRYRLTKKGDILMSRVGNIGKISMVLKGQTTISDCIYRIRAKEEHRQLIWNALTSQRGQEWLKANSHGVCAQVISKEDLLDFKV